ncbi:MAG TPA: hypothetical protein VGK89_07225 [Candidatus Eisenbacteria bacterium]|jgi:hypothetical protein
MFKVTGQCSIRPPPNQPPAPDAAKNAPTAGDQGAAGERKKKADAEKSGN